MLRYASTDSPSRAASAGEAQGSAMVMVQVVDMEVSGEVGNTFYFVESNNLGATFEVDNPEILAVTKPRKMGDEDMNASALALAVGTATVTGKFRDGNTGEYLITVKPAPTQ